MSNDAAVRDRAGEISLGAGRLAAVETQITDLRVVRNQIGNAVLAVVEDDQLLLRIVLCQKQPDRFRHKATPVCGRHNARDERQIPSHDLVRAFASPAS